MNITLKKLVEELKVNNTVVYNKLKIEKSGGCFYYFDNNLIPQKILTDLYSNLFIYLNGSYGHLPIKLINSLANSETLNEAIVKYKKIASKQKTNQQKYFEKFTIYDRFGQVLQVNDYFIKDTGSTGGFFTTLSIFRTQSNENFACKRS